MRGRPGRTYPGSTARAHPWDEPSYVEVSGATGSTVGGMANIIVFGAGGRAGRVAVAEAARRGHRVTAVVRDPGKYQGLAAETVAVVAGDVTDAARIAELAPGHDAAINTAAGFDEDHFTSAARALTAGLPAAGVGRLVAVGIGGSPGKGPRAAPPHQPRPPPQGPGFFSQQSPAPPVPPGTGPRLGVVAPPPGH